MDPLFEQRLRDEVIYLHSLWHQGPPRAHLPQFKKHKIPDSNSPEWPCPATPPPTTGWPTLQPQNNPQLPQPSAEQKWKLAQKKALKVVHQFFARDDSDAVDSSSDEEDDESSFFDKVFEEDTDLREYYHKCFANGEFSCLVCGALGGKKTLKKYKGCLPLVQHSITINSNKRRSHRAFGQAVCKVLGWDIDRLPAIVSMLTEKLGQGKCTSDNKASSVNNDTLGGNKDEAAPESGCMGSGTSLHGDMNSADAVKNLEDCGMVETRASDGLTIENSSGDNIESSSMALVNNTDYVNNDTLESKLDEAAPDSEYMGSGVSLHGDGDMNSMTSPNVGKNLEDCGVAHTQNAEERAPKG